MNASEVGENHHGFVVCILNENSYCILNGTDGK